VPKGKQQSLAFEHGVLPLLVLGAFLLEVGEPPVKVLGSKNPKADNAEKNDAQVRGGGSQRTETNNHELLNQSTSRLAQRVADYINGSLALGPGLLIQRNVGHLLAGIKQGVFGGLREDVLGSANKDGGEQGGEAQGCQRWSQGTREQDQGEEEDARDQHEPGDCDD